MQESGPHEAIEAIRKRLKHGTTEQKLRVLEASSGFFLFIDNGCHVLIPLQVLKVLMENTTSKFHRQLVSNEKMRERFELILSSPVRTRVVSDKCLSHSKQ